MLVLIVMLTHEVYQFFFYWIHAVDAGVVLDLFLMDLGQVGSQQSHADVWVATVLIRRSLFMSV